MKEYELTIDSAVIGRDTTVLKMDGVDVVSKCCKGELKVEGDQGHLGGTSYFVCSKCKKPCDSLEV